MFPSVRPTYTVPFTTAGAERTLPPTLVDHSSDPFSVASAYTFPSSLPT